MNFNLNNKKSNKVRNIPVECLLNNYIEKGFRVAYAPLNLIDKLFLCPKFNITYSFVTPTTKITNILIVIGAIFQILTHVYRFYYLNQVFKIFVKGFIITFTLFLNESMYIIASILHYGNTITQSKNSVLLMVKLQQAFRTIDLEKTKILNNHKYWTVISIICISISYCIYTYIFVAGNIAFGVGFSSVILVVSQMIFDMNIIYLTRTTDLITEMLVSWKNKVVASEAELANEHGEIHDSKSIKSLYSAYAKLIAAFNLCKNVFQVSILFHVFQTFALMLITVQITIEFGYFNIDLTDFSTILTRISSAAWNLKNFVLLVNMSAVCEKYYEILRTIEATCTQLVTSTNNEDLRKTCKNVLRFNRATFHKLSAFGVFAVDAGLPTRVLAVVLAYTVVLLQFAFLSG